ncbi:MAG TPA: iron-siderophore ABC transporter substrate-binding protein [Propionicimonas sp.]|uniref:iron-siderophore ABC transporter substrate-binding protein n=1 Tax=Propionicimonas sp. TaxID=1955623 RepID=UPI002F4136EA
MRPRSLLTLAALLPVTLLSACGTTDVPAAAPAASSASASSGPITVTDGRGKSVTLPAPATRVVSLEWNTTEDVITLGVQPTGVADIKGYGSWVTASPITGTPIDVGTRTEPSLESVAEAEPDLIIGIVGSVPESAMEQMEKIAPVVLLTGADAKRPIELMKENFTTTATLLGKEAQATTVLADLDAAIAAGKQKIAAAGKAGTPFSLSYIYAEGNSFSLRMHGPGSFAIAVASQLGLTPAWTEAGDEGWGLSTLDIEGLTKLPAGTEFGYWGNADTKDPLADLAGNKLWQSLDFVKNDRVHKMGVGIWIYGGPASAKQWISDVTGAVAQ